MKRETIRLVNIERLYSEGEPEKMSLYLSGFVAKYLRWLSAKKSQPLGAIIDELVRKNLVPVYGLPEEDEPYQVRRGRPPKPQAAS